MHTGCDPSSMQRSVAHAAHTRAPPARPLQAGTQPAVPVPGLALRSLLGRGGFGVCYYGTWEGLPVAVKVLDTQ
jgi:hypothetical protein